MLHCLSVVKPIILALIKLVDLVLAFEQLIDKRAIIFLLFVDFLDDLVHICHNHREHIGQSPMIQ